MKEFKLEKQNAINKTDKSNEGEWDDKVLDLCKKINSNEKYFTTSSCAGRITLVKSATKKIKNAFLFKTHNKATREEILKALNKNSENDIIYFRQEPCALHVSCKTLIDANNLLKTAKQSGWKRSGIFSTNKNKFTCELYSTEWIIAPVVKDNKILVDEDYINVLVEEANNKLERTWDKIKRLESEISHL